MTLFLYRTFKFAWQGFLRNFWLSLVTIIILVLTFFSVTMVAGLNVLADRAVASVQDKVDVSVYFHNDASADDILNLRYRLELLSQVSEVTYISKEQALENFKAEHSDDPVILESLEQFEESPLSASIIIQANHIDDYPSVLEVLDSSEYDAIIEDKNFDDNEEVITRLSALSERIAWIGMIVSIIFVIIAILIIFNTIRINIYTHREEIGIMKLVGGSNWFIRAPFLVESIFYGLIAVVITMALLYPLLGAVAPQVDTFFEGYNLDIVSYFSSHFWRIAGLQIAFAILLCVVSSSIAIGRYLRV